MAVLAAAIILLSASGAGPDEQTQLLAAQTGLEADQLQAAADTVGATPAVYLIYEGLLDPPKPVVAYSPLWDRLAACESSGNWSAVSRSGVYRGGLQFDQQTWFAYGGGQYAASAHLAPKTAQIAVAERLRAARGMAPWPVCGWRV